MSVSDKTEETRHSRKHHNVLKQSLKEDSLVCSKILQNWEEYLSRLQNPSLTSRWGNGEISRIKAELKINNLMGKYVGTVDKTAYDVRGEMSRIGKEDGSETDSEDMSEAAYVMRVENPSLASRWGKGEMSRIGKEDGSETDSEDMSEAAYVMRVENPSLASRWGKGEMSRIGKGEIASSVHFLSLSAPVAEIFPAELLDFELTEDYVLNTAEEDEDYAARNLYCNLIVEEEHQSLAMMGASQSRIVSSLTSLPTLEWSSLAVRTDSQLVSLAVEAVKVSAVSITGIVSSVAEATVAFVRSDDVSVQTAKTAVTETVEAMSYLGENTVAAVEAVTQEWKQIISERDSEGGGGGRGEEKWSVATAVRRVACSANVRETLGNALNGLKRAVLGMSSVCVSVATGVGKELRESSKFKESVFGVSRGIPALTGTLVEMAKRSVVDAMTAKETVTAADMEHDKDEDEDDIETEAKEKKESSDETKPEEEGNGEGGLGGGATI
eukprot:gene7633-15621_t